MHSSHKSSLLGEGFCLLINGRGEELVVFIRMGGANLAPRISTLISFELRKTFFPAVSESGSKT